jgi:hypothetical protein
MGKGIYAGHKGELGTDFTLWDSGTYRILSENKIKISTANDAEIVYSFSYSNENDTITFSDDNNCQFQYRRG